MLPGDTIAEVSSTSVVDTLLDPVRLMIAGSLAGKVRSITSIGEHTGADGRDVIAAIEALTNVGLIDHVVGGYTLPETGLRRLAAEMADTDLRHGHR